MSQAIHPMDKPKKILENPFVGSLVIPILIVVVGALIIFGVTKMLSTERTHKDLLREMHSKTFGNRWVAAYELSKLIASKRISAEEAPALIVELEDIYDKSKDPRARNFIVVAISALGNELGLGIINKAIKDVDPKVQFHAVTALGNMPKGVPFEWKELFPLLSAKDIPLQHATILTLAAQNVQNAQVLIREKLNHSEISLRYASATALIQYKDQASLTVLKEILNLSSFPKKPVPFSTKQIENLKLNVLGMLIKEKWNVMPKIISSLSENEELPQVRSKAKELLNQLNN